MTVYLCLVSEKENVKLHHDLYSEAEMQASALVQKPLLEPRLWRTTSGERYIDAP